MDRVCANCKNYVKLNDAKNKSNENEIMFPIMCGGCHGNIDHPNFKGKSLRRVSGHKLILSKHIETRNGNWDDMFMTMAYLVAMRSKDESTHIGAVVVGLDNEVRSTGYNSFVRGLNDDVEERQKRPEKYYWFEHAERNAIYNATLMGVSLKNCKMYINGIPCCDCARAIIQAGITEVIVDKAWNSDNYSSKWNEEASRTIQMFNETGVKLREWDGNMIDIRKFRNGEFLKGV